MSATIKDVAKLAGVSISTVSLVLKGSSAVKHETRYRVSDAIRQLQYTPNQSARSLVTKQHKVIGVIKGMNTAQEKDSTFDSVVDTYLSEMLRSIETQIDQSGYSMLIDWCCGLRDSDGLPALVDKNKVDGILYASGFMTEAFARQLLESGVPAVLVGSRHPRIDYVDTSPEHGIALGVKHLLEKGHRNIALINGPDASQSSERKRDGFCAAMAEAGLTPRDEWIVKGEFTGRSGYECARLLCRGEKKPTAILAATDSMAAGALRYFYEHEMLCPRDVSLIGFEDSILSEYCVPPLTSVCVCKDTLGAEAAKVLLSRIENPNAQLVRLIVEPRLVVRGSVGSA